MSQRSHCDRRRVGPTPRVFASQWRALARRGLGRAVLLLLAAPLQHLRRKAQALLVAAQLERAHRGALPAALALAAAGRR